MTLLYSAHLWHALSSTNLFVDSQDDSFWDEQPSANVQFYPMPDSRYCFAFLTEEDSPAELLNVSENGVVCMKLTHT